jgi:hypothetical protein
LCECDLVLLEDSDFGLESLLSPFPAESLLEASELLPVPFPAPDPASDLASDFSPLEAFPAPSPLSDEEDCEAPPFLA